MEEGSCESKERRREGCEEGTSCDSVVAGASDTLDEAVVSGLRILLQNEICQRCDDKNLVIRTHVFSFGSA